MSAKISVSIFTKTLKKHEEEGKEYAQEYYDEGLIDDYVPLRLDGELIHMNISFEKGILHVSGIMRYDMDDIVDISLEIPIDFAMIETIMGYAFKKLQAIKSVMSDNTVD